MNNLNLIKLIIGMQIQLRRIITEAGDMENALNEIMQGVERPPVPVMPKLVKPVNKRQTTAWRSAASERQKVYWASPKGMARRTKGKQHA